MHSSGEPVATDKNIYAQKAIGHSESFKVYFKAILWKAAEQYFHGVLTFLGGSYKVCVWHERIYLLVYESQAPVTWSSRLESHIRTHCGPIINLWFKICRGAIPCRAFV